MTTPRRRVSSRSVALTLAVAGVVLVLDQATKAWAVARLDLRGCGVPDGCIELIGSLRLRLVENTGASFSIGEGFGPWLGLLAAVMAVVLVWVSRSAGPGTAVALGLVVGGAVGNLLDRVFRADDGPLTGAVIDFIDLQWWPVFNVADIGVVTGVALLAWLSFRQPSEPPPT